MIKTFPSFTTLLRYCQSRRLWRTHGWPTRQVDLPRCTQQPVELRFETRGEECITGSGEVQRICRDLCGQLSVAVEQDIADIGIKDVLAVGTVQDQTVDFGGLDAKLSRRRCFPRQQAEQQNPRVRKMLPQFVQVGANAVCGESR